MAKKELIAKPGTGANVQHRTRCLVFEPLESRSMLHGDQFEFLVFSFERGPIQNLVDQARPAEFHGEGRTGQRAEAEFNAPPSHPDREAPRGDAFELVATSLTSPRLTLPPPAPPKTTDSVVFLVTISHQPSSQTTPLNSSSGSIADFISPKSSAVNAAAVDKLMAADRTTPISRNQPIPSPTVASDSLRNVDAKADRFVSPPSPLAARHSAASVAAEQGAGSRVIGLDGMLPLRSPLRSTGANTATSSRTNEADGSNELSGIGSRDAIDVLMRHRMGDEVHLGDNAENEPRISSRHSAFDKNPWHSDNLRLNRSSNEIAPWPEGMLSIGSVETPSNSAPEALASMDPVAIVQMFIRAGELSGTGSSPSSHSAANEAANSQPAAWLKWLRDPRISTVVSVALGLIAVATSRQTKQPPIALPTCSKKRFCR